MARVVISQETFDNAVKENIEDLGLAPEEAVKDTVEQFQAQGVDLSRVCTELVSSEESTAIIKAIETLRQFLKCKDSSSTATSTDYINQLTAIKTGCDKGVQFKLVAGKAGAYDVILDVILHHDDDNKAVKSMCLKTLTSLMTRQPDLLNDQGAQIILSHLDSRMDADIQKFTLKWSRECFILHEMNRQKLFDLHILDKLTVLLREDTKSDLLREVLAVFRALILDDDVRVEFGRGHEHARIIAGETLHELVGLLNRFKRDEPLISDLMLTLSALLVRAEFCKTVEEAGGLQLIHDVMANFLDSDKINRQCFKLIKALCGNDECKVRLIQVGLATVLVNSLNRHKMSVTTISSGLGCVAALSLRCPDNSRALFDADVPDVIVDAMRAHPDERSVQKAGSWAIRNMVSRSRYQCQRFLDLGVESLLQQALMRFRADFEFDMKAALRDLGCDVDLKEEWTGKGGALSTDAVKYQDN